MDGYILIDVKQGLGGIDASDTAFDDEIIPLINTYLNELVQIGVGLRNFTIQDATSKWSDFLGEALPHLQSVKTYVTYQVRLLFDPPTSSFVMDEMRKRVQEIQWRLNVEVDPNSDECYE